jgi:hypothetical protein
MHSVLATSDGLSADEIYIRLQTPGLFLSLASGARLSDVTGLPQCPQKGS